MREDVTTAVGMPRREFLSKSVKVAAAATAGPLLLTRGARASARTAPGELNLVAMDHVGLTVPNIAEAVNWFKDVMGAVAPLSFGPIADPTGTLMHDLLGVDPRAAINQITSIRIGHSANIELFEYTAPHQRQTHPRNSDWSGHHIAFYVTDINAAVAYMDSKGVERFLGPLPVTDGPAAGQTINYFRTPFGTFIEFISYPKGMAYERAPGVKSLWSPKRNGLNAEVTKVPGLLGVDHVGITVPNIDVAAKWFADFFAFVNPLTFGPFAGAFLEDLLDVDPASVVDLIRMVGGGRGGANVELFEYEAPDQDQSFRLNSDWGGHHIAFYVRDIDKAVQYMQANGAQKRLGPFPVTQGPAAGQTINYFSTPFGTDVELISYPHGMAYQATAPIPLWDPRTNHP